MTELSGDFDVALNGCSDLFQRFFVSVPPGRTRRNVGDDRDVCIVRVAPEDIYLETVFFRWFHSAASFSIQPVSYQQLSQLAYLITFERAFSSRLQVEPFRDVFSHEDVMAAHDSLAETPVP